MNSQKIIKHFFNIGIGTVLNMILGFLATIVITRVVDPEIYGQLSIFTLYAEVAKSVLLLGLDQALLRFFYESDEEEYKRALLGRCVVLPSVAVVLTFAVYYFLTRMGVISNEFDLFGVILLGIYSLVLIIYRFVCLVLRLTYKTKLYSSTVVVHRVLYICIALSLLFFTNINRLNCLMIATTLSVLLVLPISFVWNKNYWNFAAIKKSNFRIGYKSLLKYSLPFVISYGVTTFFSATDKICLNLFCDYTEVGIYSSTLTLVNVFAILQTTFNTLWSPISVEHYVKNPEDKRFYQKGNKIIVVLMLAFGCTIIFAKDLFAIILGEKYREAAYILPFLAFHPMMYTISESTVGGIVFKKKSGMQVLCSAISCIVNLAGNCILIPICGGKGAAISTGLSYVLFFTLRTVFANKYYYVDFSLKKFYLVLSVMIAFAAYNTFTTFNLYTVLLYIVCMAVLMTAYWDTVKYICQYGKSFALQLIKKNERDL